MLDFLAQSMRADRIGWLLIHSLWQFAFLAALSMTLQRMLQHRSANARYLVLLTIMTLMIAAPIATWFSPLSGKGIPVAVEFGAVEKSDKGIALKGDTLLPFIRGKTVPDDANAPLSHQPAVCQERKTHPWRVVTRGAASLWLRVQECIEPWLCTMVAVWFAGVFVAALRPVLGWSAVRQLRLAGVSAVPDAVHGLAARVTKRLARAHVVTVLQSTRVNTPMVVGYFRPVILLPLCVVTDLPLSQLELILAHELAHVRRHDYLVNLLQTVAETIYFYHPAVWWISRQIRIERENCCDDAAMEMAGNRAEYGRALLAIEELRGAPTVLSVAAHGGSLLARIRRIAGCEPAPRLAPGATTLCFLAISLFTAAASIWGAVPSTDQTLQPAAMPSNVALAENDTIAANGVATTDPLETLLTASGNVIDPAGKSVEGATVYPHNWPSLRLKSEPVNERSSDIQATTRSGPNGESSFQRVDTQPFSSDHWLRQNPWDKFVAPSSAQPSPQNAAADSLDMSAAVLSLEYMFFDVSHHLQLYQEFSTSRRSRESRLQCLSKLREVAPLTDYQSLQVPISNDVGREVRQAGKITALAVTITKTVRLVHGYRITARIQTWMRIDDGPWFERLLFYGQSFEPTEGKQTFLYFLPPEWKLQNRLEVLLVTLQPATPPTPHTITTSRADGTQ